MSVEALKAKVNGSRHVKATADPLAALTQWVVTDEQVSHSVATG